MHLERPTRDTVTTIRSDGSRSFLYPADTKGRFTRWRRGSALALIAFYLALPWVKINGYPAAFLDIADRRFHLFGLTLAAQDMWLLFFVITGVGFTLFFVTALLGRIWCGWACPHTVFLDHVYRRIERWIDGDALKRRALHAAPLSAGKIVRRVVKHTLYVLVSAAIMHLFLAYFVSLPEVWSMMRTAPSEHWGAFGFMAVSTGILYFNFGWFREQLCIVICPYGRLQSVLIDDHTMAIGYDSQRGEPRGRAGTTRGDCVDCARCVQVCPTGIDIRQGLQMECIGCTACIDACDDVMRRLNRPTGLVRYDSPAGFAGQKTRWLRPRTLLYMLLLLVGAAVATWAISTVKPASFGVTRMVGTPYIVDDAAVRNQFMVRIVNKRNVPATFRVSVDGAPAGSRSLGLGDPVVLGPMEEAVRPLILMQERATYTGPFRFSVRMDDAERTFQLEREVRFLGPEARLLRAEEEEHRARR
ncbi:cytochrome c oxidase accessory protein CcoG [Opitutus sp. ER46]|uniref:cytochrome c oxidase accessory protein CcoG n=1 Tax=Opitutus sp. ER46 TaxID=2161864 RepID=UPI000D2F4973|nr:cytochrome c oxidase accessory protein CcoG [Opitutus sp. ER46]PTX95829.1 cytochrome c oxidase accessory protein CcoG [Opitutus sp. ER46]